MEKRTEELRKLAASFDYESYVSNSKKKIMDNCKPEVMDVFKKMFHPDP